MKVPKITLYPRGKRGVWWVRYSYHGKTWHYSIKTYLETEAKQKVEDIKYELRHNLKRSNVTIDDLWKRYCTEELTHKEATSQERDMLSIKYLLAEFSGKVIDESAFRDQVKQYRIKRLNGALTVSGLSKKKPTNATVNREIALLKHLLNLGANEWNLLRKNPLANLKMLPEKRRERPITPDEWTRLLSEASSELRDFLIMGRFTGIRHGVRKHGILGLRWSDIDLARKEIRVRDSKNHTSRTVYMDDLVYKTLTRRKANASSEWVFPGKNGKRRYSFDKACRSACRRAGIKDLRIHDLRHQFGSDKKSQGADLQSLATLMGHKDLKTTARYGTSNASHLREIMESGSSGKVGDCPNPVQNDGAD
jgi:integrase